jgi:LytR cell envelope-related transcriptional attenuator
VVRPSATRRPLPALVFLLVLALLTAIVWWRVIHRASSEATPTPSPSCSPTAITVVPAPGAVTLHILNGTTRNGLAASVRASLAKDGFIVADIGNDDVPLASVAEIRFGPSGRAAARLVAYYVPGATLIGSARTDNQVEISLGAKFKALATTATATKAMAQDHVTQQPLPRAGAPTSAAPSPSRSSC